MSKGADKMPLGLEHITTHPYCELTCQACGSVRFYKRMYAMCLPVGYLTCHECGGTEMSSRNVTAWTVRLQDPLRLRRVNLKGNARPNFLRKQRR